MIGADVVAEILETEGCQYVFGFPENKILDACGARGIRPIIARTERVAINMADGYGRLMAGKRPAVVAVQDGPGVESSFGALAQAHADATPMFALPSGPFRSQQGYPPTFSASQSLSSISHWTSAVTDPSTIGRKMEQAMARLKNGPKGMVLVEIAKDILWGDFPHEMPDYKSTKAFRSFGDPADVRETFEALTRAKRPVIVAGNGIHYAQAWSELKQFAEQLGIPVMTTLLGKSAFPEDHPLALGTGGRSMPDTVGHFATTSDFILGIGTSFTLNDFTAKMPAGVTLAQITNSPEAIGKCYPVDYGVIGDAKYVLQQLLDLVAAEIPDRTSDHTKAVATEIASVRASFIESWADRLNDTADGPICPLHVVNALDQTFDKRTTIVTHDSGNPRDQIIPFYRATEPRGYLSWGKSTHLGSSLGLIMGAKLAAPEKLCVNLVGDTGFGQFGIDHETAVRTGTPVLTVVMNNGVMGGYGAYMPRAVSAFATNEVSGNYAALTETLGAFAMRVEMASDLIPALKTCEAETRKGRPAVLEVITREDPVLPLGEKWGM